MKKTLTAFVAAFLALSVAFCAGVSPVSVSAEHQTNNNLPSVMTANSGLNLEPTLVYEPKSAEDFAAVRTQGIQPASIVFTVDGQMNVKYGAADGGKLETVIASQMSRYIPVVRLNAGTVDGFIDWMTNTYRMADIMAISSDLEVIEKLYADEVTYRVNTVYDLTETEIPDDRYGTWQYIGAANAAGCNILMFDAADPNVGVAAEYVAAMSKVCWAYADGKLEGVNAIAAGCYGVVADEYATLKDAIGVFEKDGVTRAQFIAAHRGITAYCNENSLTALAAAANEGATHVELDVQITQDGKFMICHDSDTTRTSLQPGAYFVNSQSGYLGKAVLRDYNTKYNDTYPLLDTVVKYLLQTDLILILELKMDSASTKAVKQLKAIEKLKEFMAKYPQMEGHWISITFFAPWAEGMKEHLPQIPVGYLGGGMSGYEGDQKQTAWNGGHVSINSVREKIAFLRKYNMVLDETHGSSVNSTAANYLARGYVHNTWTFENVKHLDWKINIATTNAAEECAMFLKEIPVKELKPTAAEFEAGKITVPCVNYNGWVENRECEIIEVERTDKAVSFMLYCKQEAQYTQEENGYSVPLGQQGDAGYGLYSDLVTVTL